MAGSGSVGKAYIQVVPTTKGIQGSVTKALNGEVGAAGDVAGKEGGSRLSKAFKVAVAGAALGKFIGDSIKAGADLQQSLGGIETLYKDSADKMKDYASQAYRTAGVSANDYMQQVTSYSASLISSMGGDVDAAADVANRAMIDMADNANKLGTPIENIQNAYQGFAKQNYTMLDNLKLGYGGTKTEMERLIKDAAAMTKEQEALGITVDANSMSFENQINAISVMQKHLGITGTTALEASETISGSFGMMKAAYQDFLGNLALGNDITPQLENLIKSVGTFGKNLIPAIWNVLKGLPKAIINMAPDIADSFQKWFTGIDWVGYLEDGVTKLQAAMPKLGKALEKGLPMLVKTVSNMVAKLMASVVKYAPVILQTALDLVKTAAKGIIAAIPNILSSIRQLFTKVSQNLNTLFPIIWQKAWQFIRDIASLIITNIPTIIASIAKLGATIIKRLLSFIGTVIGTLKNSLVNVVVSVINGLKNTVANLFKGIWNAIKAPFVGIAGWFRNAFSSAWNAVKGVFSGVGSFFRGVFSTIRRSFSGMGTAFGNAVTGAIKGGINVVIGLVESIINKGIGLINSAIKLANKLPGVDVGLVKTLSLPRLAQGGIVTRETAVIAGEGRYNEAVVPLDPFYKRMEKIVGNGGGDININVYGTSGMSVDELAEAVERKLIAAQNRRRLAWQ